MLPLIQSCKRPWTTRFSMMSMLALSFALLQPQSVSSASRQGIADSMTFLSTFDRGMEAELAKGDPSIHTRTSTQPEEVVRRGLHAQGQTQWVRHGGVKGSGALQFTHRDAAWIFYRGEKMLPTSSVIGVGLCPCGSSLIRSRPWLRVMLIPCS